jgi:N-methylhydantoinase B
LCEGDWIEVRTPGGGGYGPAEDRNSEAVENDRIQGYTNNED